jgi:tetratricopeptide (TPR) repeat protein
MQMKDRGEKDTRAVRALWAEATELDPDDFGSWVELARVAFEAGDLPGARAAAGSAAKTAANDRDRSVALSELGDVQMAAGELKGARQSFEESLQIARRLAAANPSSAETRRDAAVAMWGLAGMEGTSVRWADVAAFLRGLADQGLLPPRDAGFVAEAERRAAAQR